jgi:hypothetical protein
MVCSERPGRRPSSKVTHSAAKHVPCRRLKRRWAAGNHMSIQSPTRTCLPPIATKPILSRVFVQARRRASVPGIFAAVPAGDNILTLYATGCGALTDDDLPRRALPVSVTVNNQQATVLYAGIAPGLVQGADQINIQLPDSITSSQLTIVLTAGDAPSKPFVWNQP